MTDKPKNTFGGANQHGLYVPMTDVEQEVLGRLVENKDLEIRIDGWGVVHNPHVRFGDHRVELVFQLDFHKPAEPIAVTFFDLELRTVSGKKRLLRKRYPLSNNGQPMMVGAGLSLTLGWDIAIDHMSPELVKAVKPGAIGLTTRRLDATTGNRTLLGNMNLDENQARLAAFLDRQDKGFKESDDKKAIRATEAAGYEVKVTTDGVVLPDVKV